MHVERPSDAADDAPGRGLDSPVIGKLYARDYVNPVSGPVQYFGSPNVVIWVSPMA
jgi:hypothetical protein